MFIAHSVGEPFPFPEAYREGSYGGLNIHDMFFAFTKLEDYNRKDKLCFKKSFDSYSYSETKTPIIIPTWIFNFQEPIGMIEVVIDVKKVNPVHLNQFLNKEEGIKNALMFFLLDDSIIIRGMKLIGLEEKAILLFHETLLKQDALDYTEEDFLSSLNQAYAQNTIEDSFHAGTIFKK